MLRTFMLKHGIEHDLESADCSLSLSMPSKAVGGYVGMYHVEIENEDEDYMSYYILTHSPSPTDIECYGIHTEISEALKQFGSIMG
jgi:hypothetical protein